MSRTALGTEVVLPKVNGWTLVDGPSLVRAHAASGDERVRLWDRWRQIDANLDAYAGVVAATALVALEPQPGPAGSP